MCFHLIQAWLNDRHFAEDMHYSKYLTEKKYIYSDYFIEFYSDGHNWIFFLPNYIYQFLQHRMASLEGLMTSYNLMYMYADVLYYVINIYH